MNFEMQDMDAGGESLFGKIGKGITQKVNLGLDYRIILDDLFNVLDSMIPFDRIGIALLENAGEYVSLRWVKSKIAGSNLTYGYKAKLKGSSLELLAQRKKPRIINDLVEYLSENPGSESTRRVIRDGIRSSLTFPLCVNGEVVGFAFFSSGKTGTYHDGHVEVFSEVADELAMLVGYGQMPRMFETQRRNEKLMRTTLHELRSPLGIIKGYLNLINDEAWYQNLNPDDRDLFNILRRNADAMLGLVSELSEANQLKEDGRLVLENVSIQEFCKEMDEDGKMLAHAKGIEFEMDLGFDLPCFWRFDPIKIKQVINNLISNAAKFSSRGSKINFSVLVGSEGLVFRVQDQGPGIPLEEMPRLFKEFGKTSVKPTEGEPSSGLGLMISKQIVQAHGGEMFVDSQCGLGSVFGFYLP